MKESIVEIPPESGNFYRYGYEPDSGKTVYRGPVGNAPSLHEEEFLLMAQLGVEEGVSSREDEINFIMAGGGMDMTPENEILVGRMVDFSNEARVYHNIQVGSFTLANWANKSRRFGVKDAFVTSVYQKYSKQEQEKLLSLFNKHFPGAATTT
jgi:hypothetical protein